MLVLYRKKDETVMIGDDVQVTVLGVKGSNVLLGFKAPREIPVHRKEIYKRIQMQLALNDPAFKSHKTSYF